VLFFLGVSSLNLGRACTAHFFAPPVEDWLDEDAIDIRERKTVYQGFFRIDHFRLRHRLYAGGWSPELSREIFLRHNAAAILLYDPQRDTLVFIEQFRLAAHLAGFPAWQLEIVAGIIDRDESAAAVARREAQEEAGLSVIGEIIPIHRFLPSPGGSTETVDLFCGRVDAGNAGGIHGLADESEDIKVVVKGTDEAFALLEAGKIQNAFTLIALHWFAAKRETLRRLWP
jgi:ADP-ribose pyrophosphatase